MSLPEHISEDILCDFIAEASELIEQLDQDLVQLENQPENLDLLNRIFRAIHTIKGSASFLMLETLIKLAHVAEDALNLLRKGQLQVTSHVMDALLGAADILRQQIGQLQQGQMPDAAPDKLLEQLIGIAASVSDSAKAATTDAKTVSTPPPSEAEASPNVTKLNLSESKLELLDFMVEDMTESLHQFQELLGHVDASDNLEGLSRQMSDITQGLIRSVDFYEVPSILEEVRVLDFFAERLGHLDESYLGQVLPRIEALISILLKQAEALGHQQLYAVPTRTLQQRIKQVCQGNTLEESACLPAMASVQTVLEIDQATEASTQQAPPEASPEASSDATGTRSFSQSSDTSDSQKAPKAVSTDSADKTTGGKTGGTTGGTTSNPSQDKSTKAGGGSKRSAASPMAVEQTIRVDVRKLESLLNLVGELVLQKNRVHAMVRQMKALSTDQTICENATQVASDLERVTTDLQTSVMKTRMQPMSKLFGRYPRVIRDMAKSTGKQIALTMTGHETEVDKTVLEGLADPMVHILRNCADHGLETPQERLAAGKTAQGNIHISANHAGDHVVLTVTDDGRGLDTAKIGAKALERGLITEEELATMSESAIQKLIFTAGFSTVEKVSNLSGRGVGMDVVMSNINRLGGAVQVQSRPGKGTSVSITIPLTVAIMPAMIVKVGEENYAVPLSSLKEIIQPRTQDVYTIQGSPVMRLRDEVVPLVDLRQWFGCPDRTEQGRFVLVVGQEPHVLGFQVDSLVGQQEIVIKPLDPLFEQSHAVSGATVREDGGVSLVLDVAAFVKHVQQNETRRAA